MTTATEYTIEALRQALRTAENNAASATNEPYRPWRDDPSDKTDNVAAAKEAVQSIENQIITLERSQRDPEQDAEISAELHVAMALNGVHDDVSLYMHTPMEEELFQQGIQRQLENGWYDEDGTYNEGWSEGMPHQGTCEFCGGVLWDDEVMMMHGYSGCETCLPDILGLFLVLCLLNMGFYVSGEEWEWQVSEAGEGHD
jgi:hypothetical protein